MTQQTLDWQNEQQIFAFSVLCNALYERELRMLAHAELTQAESIQGRLKSLSHYIKRTATAMSQTACPLTLDTQNGSWTSKQASKMPLSSQEPNKVQAWYQKLTINIGFVVPVALDNRIVIDMVERVDKDKQRLRTNMHGWLYFNDSSAAVTPRLLIPNKKVMMAACSGHCWLDGRIQLPIVPSLRELLISCSINWKNFKKVSQ